MLKRFFAYMLLVVLTLGTATLASAKDFEIKSATVVSGNGVLSSGLGGTLELTSGEQTAFISADDSQVYCNYLFNKAGVIEEYITGGFFNNTPWVGPMLCLEPKSPLSYTFWIGWSLGDMVHKTDIANRRNKSRASSSRCLSDTAPESSVPWTTTRGRRSFSVLPG